MKPVQIHLGRVFAGDPKIYDAQASIGSTDDGTFYRTAILCHDDRSESFDIIAQDEYGKMYHLARINVHGHGSWPSVEVFSDLEGRIETKDHGESLGRIDPIPHPSQTTTMFVFPKDRQRNL